MIRVPKRKTKSESVVAEHDKGACHKLQGCCFVCTLMNARELCAAQARDLPCLLGPLPFQLELVPSPAQPLSAGGRFRDAGLRVKKMWRRRCASVNRRSPVQWIDSPLGLEWDKGATGNKGRLLVHIMYCNL